MTTQPNIMGLMETSEDFPRHNALNHIQLCDQLDLTRMAPIDLVGIVRYHYYHLPEISVGHLLKFYSFLFPWPAFPL